MSKNIDNKSKDILNFRPSIEYIEPPQEPEEPKPIKEVSVSSDEDEKRKQKELIALAETVATLADITQKQVNERSKEVRVILDPLYDAPTIGALKRFNNTDETPKYITYDDYRRAREKLCQAGLDVAERQTLPRPVISIPDSLDADYFTRGGMDPNKNPSIIEPIDLDEFSQELMKQLVREMYKKFFYKKGLRMKDWPVVGSAIPKEIPGTKLKKKTRKTLKKLKKLGIKVIGL